MAYKMTQFITFALFIGFTTIMQHGGVYSAPSQLEKGVLLAAVHPVDHITSSNSSFQNVQLNVNPTNNEVEQQLQSRSKRAIIFRPLFVYRQQEIKKQKLKEMRQQQQQQQQTQQQIQQSASCAACQQQHSARKPVRFYAQQYPYQRW